MMSPRRLAALLVLATACSRSHDTASVAGTYVMKLRADVDTIVLRPDLRYVRSYRPENGDAATDSGRWFLTKDARMVGLKDFPKRRPFVHELMGDPKGLALLQPTTVALSVERSWRGKQRLGWHSDWGWVFDRVR